MNNDHKKEVITFKGNKTLVKNNVRSKLLKIKHTFPPANYRSGDYLFTWLSGFA